MKKLFFIMMIAVLSSCSSRIDKVFDLYVKSEKAKLTKDSVAYRDNVEAFKMSAMCLRTDELEELENRINEYKAVRTEAKHNNIIKKNMIDNMLN